MPNLRWDSDDFNTSEDQGGVSHRPGENLKQGYHHKQLLRGLVGWWPLTYSSGDAKDLSGNGNHGTTNGSVTRGVAGKAGLRAYSFDGSDDYVREGSTNISSAQNSADAATVAMWVKAASGQGNHYYLEQSNGGTDGSGKAYQTFQHYNGNYRVYYQDPNSVVLSTSNSVDDGTWHHIAYTYNGSDFYLYRDGQQVDSNTGVSATHQVSNNGTFLGVRGDGLNDYYKGEMTDVRAYDRALSSNEIQMLYNLGNVDAANPPGNKNGGVSYYSFNSSNANDRWGSNDGTVNGATYQSNGGPRNDGAYSFDGTDDYIDTGITDLTSYADALSVFGWIRADNLNNRHRCISKDQSGTPGMFNIDVHDTNDEWQAGVHDGSWHSIFGPPVVTGTWTHVGFTFDSSASTELKLYVNGTIEASASGIGTLTDDTGAFLAIGADGSGSANDPLAGDVDDVRIYNRALEPYEIQQLYLHGTRGVNMNRRLVDQ